MGSGEYGGVGQGEHDGVVVVRPCPDGVRNGPFSEVQNPKSRGRTGNGPFQGPKRTPSFQGSVEVCIRCCPARVPRKPHIPLEWAMWGMMGCPVLVDAGRNPPKRGPKRVHFGVLPYKKGSQKCCFPSKTHCLSGFGPSKTGYWTQKGTL